MDRYFSSNVPDGCYRGCNLACAKGAEQVTLTRGPRAGEKVGIDGPEYETCAAVTSMGIFAVMLPALAVVFTTPSVHWPKHKV